MRDFIKKKREMFIVAMLIKEKEKEIEKLTTECEREEAKLRQDTQKLQEDQIAHDREIQQVRLLQQERSKQVEKEAEEQSKKNQELKQLEQQIEKLQEDVLKATVCRLYLTEIIWFIIYLYYLRERKRTILRRRNS